MGMLPDYVGPCAFGIKMGVLLPGCNLTKCVVDALEKAANDELLDDGDTICLTESVVARSQNNYITTSEVAEEIREKCSLNPDQTIGVLFPITSRNRFVPVLQGIAEAVNEGEVIIQLPFPDDEVGNQILPQEVVDKINKECITLDDLDEGYKHPLTGVDYLELYQDTVVKKGASPTILLCNNPTKIMDHDPDAIIVANIHEREKTKEKLIKYHDNVVTLQEICCDDDGKACSEWGLLGSNLSTDDKIKLAPYKGDEFAVKLKEQIKKNLCKDVEVIIYGDGAYKDPSSGIYELADPVAAFGKTPGLDNKLREGIKLKYLIDDHHEDGLTEEEITQLWKEKAQEEREKDSMESEGTTPRRIEDVLASLADLVSGSADAGTPLIVVKGIA